MTYRWLIRLLVLLLGGPLGVLVLVGAPAGQAAQWVAPLAGPLQVTRAFDPPENPHGPGHRGVDLAGSPGQVVLAAGAGTIGYAAPLAGRGVVTVLHEAGLRTTYEPVPATVVVGQTVAPGQPIGTLAPGHAGCPVSACLHWGLLRGEVYLDPLSLLGVGPVRLLPSAPGGHSEPGAGAPLVRSTAWESSRSDPVVPAAVDGVPVAATVALGVTLGATVLAWRRRGPP